MRNPYDVLGLPAGSRPEELKARYEELKKQYSEERFAEGEAGNEAARKLNELESSWKQIEQDIRREQTKAEFGGEYGKVESAINAQNYDGAQRALDEIVEHDAKWHYYQSIIFYKRDWLSESRAQLVIAIQMDPQNMKYHDALRKMDAIMGNGNVNPQNMGTNQQGPYAQYDGQYYYDTTPEQQAARDANTCANCVLCYCLTESCCHCMRC